jgi:hypothetical protein
VTVANPYVDVTGGPTGIGFDTHNPIAAQQAPMYYRPVWHVGHLVFQGGVPNLKRSSLTGGGFIYKKDLFGMEGPSWQPYATPLTSAVGSGIIPRRSNFLTALFGGQVGPNQ